MPEVTVELPGLLEQMVNVRTVRVEGDTLMGALRALVARHPALDVHLFDEGGSFREHVLCFHNDTNTRWLDSPDVPLRDGDTITILQAVSGG